MADAAASSALGNGVAMEDPEKKKKKEEKAREKEAKKAKAAAKAEAAAAAQAAKSAAGQPGLKKQEAKAKKSQAVVAASDTASTAAAAAGGDVQDPLTPHGEKKRMAATMAKAYNPRAVEAAWYSWWEFSGFFTPEVNSSKPMFSIVVPPPNITGYLHLGHALTATVQDAIVRWKRMSGFNVLWVPGTDHAGIATQTVVEKKIMREKGLTRHDLGREAFLKEVWEWRHAYGNKIGEQQRRMGASLDWTRAVFTMDEKRSEAVTEAFVRMHGRGLIYRDQRLVNWDCVLRTAISDIEVDYIQIDKRTMLRVPGYGDELVEFGAITSFAYPLADGEEGGEIVVATTRPETMLGDTAVAVHPRDERYMHLHGKFAVHPFNGRRIPIICDAELVDMAFGTGAVKITPAHDPNDFETGKRHNLEFVNILTDDGFINGNGGEFAGLKRFEARVVVVKRLQEMGLYRGVADNPMRLGLCSRSKDVIEPMIKPQWYVKCDRMAAEACDAVRDGRLTIIPKQFEDVWFRWLENIRDWCISRQLWWGHRIPAWYVVRESDKEKAVGTYNDQWVVARTAEEAEAQARRRYPAEELRLEQDPDVLDTWFSSGLFPFSVFEWPAQTADLDNFYPTSLLETGHDILFFWVARMVMMGMTLTGKVPFSHVFLHAMVRDAHGRKMSKSLGNVIDPLEVIEGISLEELHKKLEAGNLDPKEIAKAKAGQKSDYPDGIAECGTDALRFCLLAYTTQANNINLDIQRVVGYRLWCNKLWNAIKFAIMTLGEDFTPPPSSSDPAAAAAALSASAVPSSCRWILSVLSKAVRRTVTAMEAYDLAEATTAIYHWWQYQLCDVFIELSKPALNSADESAAEEKRATRETLWTCLDTGLRLLHPFMPFVTEELWQRLPSGGGCQGKAAAGKGEEEKEEEGKDLPTPSPSRPPSIMVSEYPRPVEAWEDTSVEEDMVQAEDAVRAIRSLRNGYGLQKNQRPECFVQCKSGEVADRLARCRPFILTLAALSKVEVLKEGQSPPPGCAVAIVDEGTTVHLMLRGLVDADSEISKLQKKTELLLRQQEDLRKKTSIPGYAEKVPAAVQEEHAAKAAKVAAERETIDEAIRNFQKLLLST